jgi:hypothetical protein
MKSPQKLARELSRRNFIKTTALAGMGTALVGKSASSSVYAATTNPPTPSFPYTMVFNSDVCNSVTLYSSYNQTAVAVSSSPSSAPGNIPYIINASVAETAAAGAQCHMFAPNTCWVPWWQSKVYPIQTHLNWVYDTYGNSYGATGDTQLDPITQWVAATDSNGISLGNDLVQTYINACRTNGVAAFVSFRMNDPQLCQNAFNTDTYTPYSGLSVNPLPEFESVGFNMHYANNPQWCLGYDSSQGGAGASPLQCAGDNIWNWWNTGYPYSSMAQNWAFEEVRDFRFDLIQELCSITTDPITNISTSYDIDGIELDFTRQIYYFGTDPNGLNYTPVKTRYTTMSGFIKEVANVLAARYQIDHKKRYLSLRIPCDTTQCENIGIDFTGYSCPSLASLGVDMITVSPSYYTLQTSDFQEIVSAANPLGATNPAGVPTTVYANLEMTNDDQGGYQYTENQTQPYYTYNSNKTYRRSTPEQLYTTAALGYSQGAHGMSLFNFAYYRENVNAYNKGTGNDWPYSDPPFSVMEILGSSSNVYAQQNQHYFNGGGAGIMTPPTLLPIVVPAAPGAANFSISFTLVPPTPTQSGTTPWSNRGVFRLVCSYGDPGDPCYTFSGTKWVVTLTNSANSKGVTLQYADYIEPYQNPWSQFLGLEPVPSTSAPPLPQQHLTWIVPANLLVAGTNTFNCVQTASNQYLRINYADLAISSSSSQEVRIHYAG